MSDTPARTYGGQAVVEGVMMRGPNTMAVAVRAPDGNIVAHSERLSGLYTTPLRLVPLLRGVAVLAESLTLGVRALSWSAVIAAGETDDEGKPADLGVAGWGALFITMSAASLIFFLGPVAYQYENDIRQVGKQLRSIQNSAEGLTYTEGAQVENYEFPMQPLRARQARGGRTRTEPHLVNAVGYDRQFLPADTSAADVVHKGPGHGDHVTSTTVEEQLPPLQESDKHPIP